MSLTMAELSAKTGISTATISRVLNGDKRVSPEMRERVMAALAESGYEKRPRRSSASSRNDRTVMIIVAQLHNPITLGFIDGIRRRLARAGMKTVITLSDYSSETECEMLAYAERSGFSGIFMLNAVECPRLISLLDSASAPVIFVNRYPRSRDSDVIAVDNYRSGYLATKYLIDRGHRAIAHIAGPRTSMTCRDRQRGFEDAMRTAGLPLDAGNIFYGDRSYKSGCECGEKIGKMPQNERFTAVFSATGVMAAGMIDRLRALGIRVPEDVSVICNDDYSRDYMPCPIDLTTYEQDPEVMGETAAELMLERAAAPDMPPRRIVFPPVLIERNSVKTREK